MPTTGTSSKESEREKGIVVRDNIHGYIALTKLESAFLAQREFHRLHFVSQNGLVFHTYPATRHTRFLHSLGSMHLAGAMLLSGMRSGTSGAAGLRKALEKYIDDYRGSLRGLAPQVIQNDRLYSDLGIENDWLLCVMFQGVRIASLIHDIGHPPFSHTVEQALELTAASPNSVSNAIERLESEADGLHEKIGQYMLKKVMLLNLTGSPLQSISSAFVELAIDISVHYLRDPALEALKGVIDGQFDCDRGDYVLRDCAAAGVDFGGYDLARILPAITVVECNKKWYFRPSLKSLAAIESFYEERLKLYRWIIFHHSCVRSHIALQRTTIFAIRLYEGLESFFTHSEIRYLREFVGPIELLWDFKRYHLCDDNWYFSFLARLLRGIVRYMEEAESRGEACSPALVSMRGFIEQARWRKKTMRTLWKRIDEYRAFCEGVREGWATPPPRVNDPVVPLVNTWLHQRLDKALKLNGLAVSEWIEAELEKQFGVPFAVSLERWAPVGIEPALKRVADAPPGVFLVDNPTNGCAGLIPLGETSPVPTALGTVWENSIHFRAYVLQWNAEEREAPSPRQFGEVLVAILASDEIDRFSQPPAASAESLNTKEGV